MVDSILSAWIGFFNVAYTAEKLHMSLTRDGYKYRDMLYDTREECLMAAKFEAIRMADSAFVGSWH